MFGSAVIGCWLFQLANGIPLTAAQMTALGEYNSALQNAVSNPPGDWTTDW